MNDTPEAMRSVASCLSYNDLALVPSAKHLLLSAASQIERLTAAKEKDEEERDALRSQLHDGHRWTKIRGERDAAITRAEKLEAERNALGNALWSAEDQWGDDYLWEKWNLSKHLTKELKDELMDELMGCAMKRAIGDNP